MSPKFLRSYNVPWSHEEKSYHTARLPWIHGSWSAMERDISPEVGTLENFQPSLYHGWPSQQLQSSFLTQVKSGCSTFLNINFVNPANKGQYKIATVFIEYCMQLSLTCTTKAKEYTLSWKTCRVHTTVHTVCVLATN